MTKQEYILLYEKYVSGNCSDEEKKLFENYADEFNINDSKWDSRELGNEQALVHKMYKRFYRATEKTRKSRWSIWARLSAAAIVLMVSTMIYLSQRNANFPAQVAIDGTIKPGANKAILTLDDGSTILLDDAHKGTIASQGKTKIQRNEDGQVVYQSAGTVQNSKIQILSNTITTPRGSEAQVTLPDGTKVWLNAESSIKFPTVFSGTKRQVELSGEAYMEVAENKKMPFLILVNGTEVEVLGTHFNISAYADQAAVTTSLLQGSVKLRNHGHEAILKPGQEGTAAKEGAMKVRQAAVDEAIAWKNGLFIFQNENIYSIMTKIARWYDIEVNYIGSMEGKAFDAKVDRKENITELLKNMELTGTVQFKIKGRRVTVMSR